MTRNLYQPVTTVFKPSESVKDSFSLYVNGQKTNIYYYTKPMLFTSAEQQHKDAIQAAHFIKEGKVYPSHGNWAGFDLCASCLFTINDLKQLPAACPWSNTITSVLTPYKIEPEQHAGIIRKWTGITVNTQFSKRIVQGEISNAVGIYIDNYGYSLYFI